MFFFVAGQNIAQTFRVADITALNHLQPQPADYFLGLNARHEVPDKNKIHCYVGIIMSICYMFFPIYGMLTAC